MNKNLKTVLLYDPDRYQRIFDDGTTGRELDTYLSEHVPCNFLSAETWEDFLRLLDNRPDLIAFCSRLFKNKEIDIFDLVKTFETIIKLKNINPKIAVCIDRETSQHTISLLKKSTKAVGLQLTKLSWGEEQAVDSWQQLLNNKEYWPQDIIRQLPHDKKQLCVYFRDDVKDYGRPEMQNMMASIDSDFELCAGWKELTNSLEKSPEQIFFHIDMVKKHGGSVSEFKMMLETLFKYTENSKIKLGVSIDATTTLATIKEMQKSGILGIVPSFNDWGTDECSNGIRSIINGIPYWPKHILAQLPGNDVKKMSTTNAIVLTTRQQEVYNLIAERGLSNKQIARVLNIAESTVKIHVSAVMKSYCVRNRTQLALSAQK
jgi:DNA-binding CsgD family transcriptional regulator